MRWVRHLMASFDSALDWDVDDPFLENYELVDPQGSDAVEGCATF